MTDSNSTVLIAEIGENHIGNWDMALAMLEAAADSGADIAKFQSYLGTEVDEKDPERDWFTKVSLPEDMHSELKTLAEQKGIEFMSAPFSLERAKMLVEKIGLKKIKVASSEMTNQGLLSYLNTAVDTVFLSTGLSSLDEIKQSVDLLRDVETVYVLQCTTQYPCPDEQANLRVISTLAETFPERKVGFSDHTIGTTAPIAAVALGAQAVEKHFTLSTQLPGTDHVLSATPAEFREMTAHIRRLESMLGNGQKEPTVGEREIIDFVRTRFPKTTA